MKNIFTTTLVLACLWSLPSFGCKREGSFTGKEGETVSGTAKIEADSEGKLTLSFENFSTTPGPDLDVYLTKTGRVSSTSINISALKSQTGNQSYVLPDSIKIDDFDYVSVHCTQYDHWYGLVQLGASTGDCSILGFNVISDNTLNAYAIDKGIVLESELELSGALNIYTVDGKNLYSAPSFKINSASSIIDINYTGMVLLIHSTDNGVRQKRLFVR